MALHFKDLVLRSVRFQEPRATCKQAASDEEQLPNDTRGQTSLLSLPNEVLSQIVQDPCLSREDLRCMAVVSGRLLDIVRGDFYRRDNFRTFRQAIETADLAMMKRCAEYDATPNTVSWTVKPGILVWDSKRCPLDGGLMRRHHLPDCNYTPCEYIFFNLRRNRMSPAKCFEMLRVIHGTGANLCEHSCWRCRGSGIESRHRMPRVLLDLLKVKKSRGYRDDLCEIVRWLHSLGVELPVKEAFDHTPLPLRLYVNLEDMLRTYYPPLVLEILLKELDSEGVHLGSSHHDVGFENGADLCQEETLETRLKQVLINLTNDFTNPWGCEIGYVGEMGYIFEGEIGDIFETKIGLLVKYQGVTDLEKQMLETILEAVRKLESEVGVLKHFKSRGPRNEPWEHERRESVGYCRNVLNRCLDQFPYIPRDELHSVSSFGGEHRTHVFHTEPIADPDPWKHWYETDPEYQ
ncbi:hypothetical protein FZEAL_9502 [Fusarium zealandicum]|uniref:F-box domain-containing protein n=1 Tax=Fusarium zealandicum TaxID=1053134 RepID=A0A8H4UAJ9_9HYPO|nr:hypothetical protein FZEAL_9502 [Fusarium zealandicum]